MPSTVWEHGDSTFHVERTSEDNAYGDLRIPVSSELEIDGRAQTAENRFMTFTGELLNKLTSDNDVTWGDAKDRSKDELTRESRRE